jgi:small subunit ribosomal protein S13
MARLAGVNIPDDKRVVISLTYIFGVGRTTAEKLAEDAGIDPSTRTKDLSSAELGKLRSLLEGVGIIEGDLRRKVAGDIKRLREAGTYRGERHKNGLPGRGQRTKTNARTKRGKRVTMGSGRKKAASKT